MAISNFYMSVNLGGSPTNPNQATSFQIVTPWGQTNACSTWEEAVMEAFFSKSRFSGVMGSYFQNGTTNGISTGSQTVPNSATNILTTP